MAGTSGLKTALFLGVLMVLGGPLNTMVMHHDDASEHIELFDHVVAQAIAGEHSTFLLPGNDVASTSFTLDVPSDAPITNVHLSMEPSVQPTQTGFTWNSNAIWSASTAVHNGTFGSDDVLTGDGGGTLWDFNTNAGGWTFSNSYSARVTSPACGFNGSSGGSLRTYAGSTYATSPVIDFSGVSAMPFHAWVHEGRSGCGETPDGGEDLQFQYKTASGTWTTFNTFSGGGSQTSNFQYMTNLPPAALHTNSQVRIHQTSGSSTCCDYWFVDDVHFATPPSADWTSPTIGFGASDFQKVNAGPWAPLYLDAAVPAGGELNWTILDGSTNQPIEGFHGSGAGWIPTNALDWTQHTSIKVHFYLEPAPDGRMASIYSLSGDGLYASQFQQDPTELGWTLGGNAYYAPFAPEHPNTPPSVNGSDGDTLLSPWLSTSGAVASAMVTAEYTDANISIRYAENEPWAQISEPFSVNLAQAEGTTGRIQVQFSTDYSLATSNGSTNSTNMTTPEWSVSGLELGLMAGLQPATPSIDFEGDGNLEWGGSDARVGSWGMQDRFENGQTSMAVNPGLSGYATGKAWVPVTDLSSFSFSAISYNGNLDGVLLRVGNDEIANWSLNGSAYLALDSNQLDLFTTTLASQTSTVGALGTSFAEVTFETTGTGNVTLGGLAIPYTTGTSIDAGSDSSFVLALNTIRFGLTPSNGLHEITVPFSSSTPGGLHVAVEGMNTSSAVQMVGTEMLIDDPVLTPSQRWQTMNTTYNLYGSSASLARLDVTDGRTTGTWLLPMSGSTPVGIGSFEYIELHPDSPLVVIENGLETTISITFRIEPSWDDAEQLRATSRLVLTNTVISIPSVHVWGGPGAKGMKTISKFKMLSSLM